MAVNGTPSHSYGVSLAIWDHTVLPAARHKWTHPLPPNLEKCGNVVPIKAMHNAFIVLPTLVCSFFLRSTHFSCTYHQSLSAVIVSYISLRESRRSRLMLRLSRWCLVDRVRQVLIWGEALKLRDQQWQWSNCIPVYSLHFNSTLTDWWIDSFTLFSRRLKAHFNIKLLIWLNSEMFKLNYVPANFSVFL